MRVLLILTSLLLVSCDYYLINDYDQHVGVIRKSNTRNTGEWSACYKEKIFPYYYGRNPASFAEGKDSLRQHFRMRYYNHGITNESGYITVRFIINCKGEPGMFEIRQVGMDFKKKKFNKQIVDQLFEILLQLESWKPVEFYGDKYDSFYHLTFKIENGELKEILP